MQRFSWTFSVYPIHWMMTISGLPLFNSITILRRQKRRIFMRTFGKLQMTNTRLIKIKYLMHTYWLNISFMKSALKLNSTPKFFQMEQIRWRSQFESLCKYWRDMKMKFSRITSKCMMKLLKICETWPRQLGFTLHNTEFFDYFLIDSSMQNLIQLKHPSIRLINNSMKPIP